MLDKPYEVYGIKRLTDLVGAGCGIVVFALPMIIIALLIKIRSPGPILYRGVRTGKGGHPFEILKFRTMVPDAGKLGGPSTARNDPRTTQIGRVLRRLKLDELPQLFNVLRGEMSLVGPRPEVPEYTALYEGDERLVIEIRPGISDFASLHFSDMDETLGDKDPDRIYRDTIRPLKNQLRVKYFHERSFGTDLKILLFTAVTVFGRLLGIRTSSRKQ